MVAHNIVGPRPRIAANHQRCVHTARAVVEVIQRLATTYQRECKQGTVPSTSMGRELIRTKICFLQDTYSEDQVISKLCKALSKSLNYPEAIQELCAIYLKDVDGSSENVR